MRWRGSSVICSAVIDSSAQGNFIDEAWAKEHGIHLKELCDLSSLNTHLVTVDVSLTISVNNPETIFIFHSPLVPIVLGHPWLVQHNPQINWAQGSIFSWTLPCHVKCLVSAVPDVSSVPVF